jgi:ABC-type transport system involved in multi-copper enzyme maturation permease subunit
MMGLDARRTRAVIAKELLDYRRNRAIVVTMLILPFVFLIEPIVTIFLTPATKSGAALDHRLALSLLYLLLTPVIMPATLAAYSVAGEREQGTLEPLLTTPVSRQEFILGKAAAVMIPTLLLSYTLFGVFFAVVRLLAHPVVASAVFHDGPVILALFLLAPLVAGWAIVAGMAVSVRATEVRVAQQLGMLASLPILGAVSLLAVGVIHPTFTVAVEFAAGLLAIDVLALRLVSSMFDRERLVTGAKAVRSGTSRESKQPASSAPRHLASNAETRPLATATLALSRKWGGLIDRNREWQIEIDGDVVGSIASQKSVELRVDAGHHTVRLSSHRHSSPQRSFEAAAGQVVRFRCRAATLWPRYVAALIKPDLWISLKQARGSAT